MQLANGNYQGLILLGLDDATLVGRPTQMLVGKIGDLQQPDAILVDEAGFHQMWPGEPLKAGKVIEMNDCRAVVVGVYRASQTFMTMPIIYTRYSQATLFIPPLRRMMPFVLVKCKDGVSAVEVARRIEADIGLKAQTRDEFSWMTMFYYLQHTGIPVNFGTTVILAFLVGCAVAGQTFYLFTVENLKQFGTLKAMGMNDRRVVAMILIQALVVAVIGYGFGVGLATLYGMFAQRAMPLLAFFLPWQVLAITAVAVLFISLLSSLLSVDRILEWSQFHVLTWGQMELPSERDGANVCSFDGRLVGAAVNAVGFAFQLHNRRAVHDPIQKSHRQLRVAEVSRPGFEVDVGNQGGAGALAAGVDDLVPQAGGLRTEAAFDAVKAEFVNDEEVELGIEADTVREGLVGHRSGEVFQQFAAGDVVDGMLEHARSQADALDEPAFAEAALARKDDVLLAADEVALGQRFDLESRNRRVEVPVECAQGRASRKLASLMRRSMRRCAAQAGLSGEQAVQELQVRSAVLFGVGQGGVELVGGDGHAQSREVGEDLITQAWAGRGRLRRRIFLWTGLHGRVPRVRVIADSRWPDGD